MSGSGETPKSGKAVEPLFHSNLPQFVFLGYIPERSYLFPKVRQQCAHSCRLSDFTLHNMLY